MGHWGLGKIITTDNCTGEAFGELFLAMTDNLSSKCDNCMGEAFGELYFGNDR